MGELASPSTLFYNPSIPYKRSEFDLRKPAHFLLTMHLPTPLALTTLLAVATARPYAATLTDLSLNTATDKRQASPLTPKGGKAGLSGYPGIESQPAFAALAPHISWYADYTPNPPTAHGVQGVGMLWGGPRSGCADPSRKRLATFSRAKRNGKVPEVMLGFYEPDCSCPSSSEMGVEEGVKGWERLLAPLKEGGEGKVLGSPSMCKQYDEDWLREFEKGIDTPWDVTVVHVNKPTVAEAKKVVEYYASTYGKPVWVAEFACVHDQGGWAPCTDQAEIDRYLRDVVRYFEGEERVVAYGPSNGEGLGEVWPLTDGEGRLMASGRTYLEIVTGL